MKISELQHPDKQTGAMPTDLASLDAWLEQKLDEKLARRKAARTPSFAVIATKGSMDMAYPPLILASTAAALGWDSSIFFTFYGLELLKKDLQLKVSPLGNPAMPMKMPFGPEWLQHINMNVPNFVAGNMPGFESFATAMLEKTTRTKGVPSILELRDICVESGVKLFACQMTVDLFNYRKEEFIPEIEVWIGATSYLSNAKDADVCLFV
jgi:peroxiredoxin family protein